MIMQNFDATWRTLENLASAGGTIPADLLAIRDARRFMHTVVHDLRNPETVLTERLDGVDSEATAQALLDDYIDAMTRREHAGFLSRDLDRLTCEHLEARLRTGGLDAAAAADEERAKEAELERLQAAAASESGESQPDAAPDGGTKDQAPAGRNARSSK